MLKKIGKLFIVISFLFLPLKLISQDITVNASVSSTEVEVGEQFTYTITVSGNIANVPNPKLPPLPNFKVYNAGTSSSFQFINGTVSSSITHNYTLIPTKVGTFTIGAAKIEYKGKVYQTSPITVKVVPASQKPKRKVKRRTPSPSEQFFAGQNQSEIFVRAIVNKKKVYVSEPVIFRYKLYYKNAAVTRYGISEMPSFTGFWVEDVPPPKRITRKVETYNGSQYYTAILDTKILFPTSPGIHKIGKTKFQLLVETIFSFFGQRVDREANPVTLEVMPLPEKGKPDDFKGSVGNFRIYETLSTKKIKQNEPFVLKVTISGSGNIKAISEPVMPELKDFKLYDSRSTLNIQKTPTGIKGSKNFEYILIPTMAGKLKIDSFRFSYFNPYKRKYITLKTKPLVITVKPGTSQSPTIITPGGVSAVKLIGKDIRFIKEIGHLKNQGTYIYKSGMFWFLAILPFVILGLAYSYSRYKLKLETDVKFARASRSFKLAKKRIMNIKKKLQSNDLENISADFEKLLTGYIGDKLNIPSASIVVDEIKKILKEKKIPDDLIDKIVDIYDRANMLRYAPSQADKDEYKKMLTDMENVLNQFETIKI